MKIWRIFIAASWPCFVVLIASILFLSNENHDQSAGMGAIILICILPIAYVLSLSVLLLIYKICYKMISISVRRSIFSIMFVGFVILSYSASNGEGSESRLLYLIYSLLFALITIIPMVFFVEYGIIKGHNHKGSEKTDKIPPRQ